MIKDSTAVDIPRIADNVGGVLTGKGKFILEPSLQYSYADNNRVSSTDSLFYRPLPSG